MSDSIKAELAQAEQLMTEGYFEKALQFVKTLEEKVFTPHDWLLCQILKSDIHKKMGQLEDALKIAEHTYNEAQKLKEPLQAWQALIRISEHLRRLGKLDAALETIEQCEQLFETLAQNPPADIARLEGVLMFHKSLIYWRKGDFNPALEFQKKALSIAKNEGDKLGIASTLTMLGTIYAHMGDLDQCLEYLKRGLAVKKEFGHKEEIARSLLNIGITYEEKGDLNQALDYYQQSLVLQKALGNKKEIAMSLNNIGNIYKKKGDFDQALEFYQQSLALRKPFGNKYEIGAVLGNIGLVYWQKGDLDHALKYLKQHLTLFEEYGNNFHTSKALFHLIAVAIDKNSLEQAQKYLLHLQKIDSQEENKIINQRNRVAEALVLKTSTRIKDWNKAEQLLKKVAEEEIVDHALTISALLNLCELILTRIETFNTQEPLKVLQSYVDQLFEIAQKQASHSLLATTYILQTRGILIELQRSWSFEKIKELNTTLDEVRQLAQEKQLFVILAQAHLLLALSYDSRMLFDEAKAEIQEARMITIKRNLLKESKKLEEISQQIQTSEATYLGLLEQTFEQGEQELRMVTLEQEFRNSIDDYLQTIKTALVTLDRT
ncbi:MAG: tetratricopeptide repeat protein [Candidatus Hermodarchaeota archaeon]